MFHKLFTMNMLFVFFVKRVPPIQRHNHCVRFLFFNPHEGQTLTNLYRSAAQLHTHTQITPTYPFQKTEVFVCRMNFFPQNV